MTNDFEESIYFGKPMVGIPIMFDQHLNVRIAEHKGYGLCVSFEDLSPIKISSAINKVLKNARFVLV